MTDVAIMALIAQGVVTALLVVLKEVVVTDSMVRGKWNLYSPIKQYARRNAMTNNDEDAGLERICPRGKDQEAGDRIVEPEGQGNTTLEKYDGVNFSTCSGKVRALCWDRQSGNTEEEFDNKNKLTKRPSKDNKLWLSLITAVVVERSRSMLELSTFVNP
ncbi:hypothetical protein Tco_1193955 [Tanacetum coccineum]